MGVLFLNLLNHEESGTIFRIVGYTKFSKAGILYSRIFSHHTPFRDQERKVNLNKRNLGKTCLLILIFIENERIFELFG